MIYYEELAYTVMEAEKSHSLPSASWRPRKAGGVIQSEPEGLKPWEPMVQVPVQKQEKANLASEWIFPNGVPIYLFPLPTQSGSFCFLSK